MQRQFIDADILAECVQRVDKLLAGGQGYKVVDQHTILQQTPDESKPLDPLQQAHETRCTSLACDLFPRDSFLQLLFRHPEFLRLVEKISGSPRLYCSQDPLAALSVYSYPGESMVCLLRSALVNSNA